MFVRPAGEGEMLFVRSKAPVIVTPARQERSVGVVLAIHDKRK